MRTTTETYDLDTQLVNTHLNSKSSKAKSNNKVKKSAYANLHGLYVITDPNALASQDALIEGVRETLQGGAKLIQYRNKKATIEQALQEAHALKTVCDQYDAHLLINDSIDIAEQVGCGVHLGQSDNSVAIARERLGSHALIGATCHDSIALARKAIEEGASYIAFGRLFPSSTKPNAPSAQLETISRARACWPKTPIVGIGGITLDNTPDVIASGANMVAVIQSIWSTTDRLQTSRRFSDRCAPQR